jgi:class 3 adenylate cyclase/tetratricopeptide (TPR) repeat protein
LCAGRARGIVRGKGGLSTQKRLDQLEEAIAAQESVRGVLGDTVVDAVIAALRHQIQALKAEAAAEREGSDAAQLMTRLMPQALADKARAAARRSEGETKQVTMMFADLCGFTALGERVDAETVRAFQTDLFAEMASVVYQYEGFVEKFVGDAIMSVFGAPVAHEDDPDRALRAALAMRSRMAQINARWAERLGQALSLHIGVNTGNVIAGDLGVGQGSAYAVTGDTVNTTQRLQSAAAPGQILVSRDTYRRTRDAFAYTELDPILVKGKNEPLPVYELTRAKMLPERSHGVSDLATAFAGRDRELGELIDVLAGLERGRGRIVSINGEAGIGKSRLLAQWRRAAGERVRFIEGRAFAHTTSLAYGPFIDLLRRHARITDDDSEAEARARLDASVDALAPGDDEAHAILASLLGMRPTPEDTPRLAAIPAEVLRGRIHALIYGIFERLARERPTVLVIEDLHWADAASIELIEHLLPLAARVPLAMVGVRRREQDDEPSKLLRHVQAKYADQFTYVILGGLSESCAVDMIGQLLSTSAVPEVLKEVVLKKADGNPFFVEEVLRVLIERGALVQAAGGWQTTPLVETVAVPDTVQGVLMARLDALPDETKWVVQQASVIGRVFLYRVLLHIAENDPSLDADLTHLGREELIRERARQPEIEFIFRHALTQEVAFRSLLTPRRRELHKKVGDAMVVIFATRLGEVQGIIGEHFFKGESWAKAVTHLAAAGEAAARLFAYAEAASYFTQAITALSHLPDSPENRAQRVELAWRLASVSFAVDPTNNMQRLLEAEPAARELAAADAAVPNRVRLARVHYWIGRIHFMRGEPREAIQYFKQVLAVAKETGDVDLMALPSSVIGRALAMQGRWGDAEALLAQAVAPLERVANWYDYVATVVFLGAARAIRGNCAAGIADVDRGLARAGNLQSATATAVAHCLQTAVHLALGDAQKMHQASSAVVAVSEGAGDRLWTGLGYSFRGWAESRLGRHDEAAASRGKGKAIIAELGGRVVAADWFAAADAELALNAGRAAEAAQLAEAAVALAQKVGGIQAAALAERTWGVALARLDPFSPDAAGHLRESLRLFEEGDSRVEVARTHEAWGDVCRARGDDRDATEHHGKALARFEACGLPRDAQRVRERSRAATTTPINT